MFLFVLLPTMIVNILGYLPAVMVITCNSLKVAYFCGCFHLACIQLHDCYVYLFQSCCYQRSDRSYISISPDVGFQTQYNPFKRKHRSYYTDELDKQSMCCSVSDELCDLFYTVRPQNSECSLNSDVTTGKFCCLIHLFVLHGPQLR